LVRSRTIFTALASATLVGAPAVAQASSPIRFAYVTTGTPRSLPAPTVGSSAPLLFGVLVLRRAVPTRTPVRFVFSRLRGTAGERRRVHLAVSMPRLASGDRALAVPLPGSAYASRAGAWVLSIHVGGDHRGFLFRVRR
jgi:hypothetical protein